MNHETLWAPWRMAYLRDLERQSRDGGAPTPGGGSADGIPTNFLAEYWSQPENDAANLVVMRDAHGMVLMNRYPYSGGHLLVALGDPRPSLLDYDPDQRAALWRLVEIASDMLQRAVDPQGLNIGINQGAAAGAGLPEHLHVHVVPRWRGDTNFITTVGDVRVIPASLEQMYEAIVRVRDDVTAND